MAGELATCVTGGLTYMMLMTGKLTYIHDRRVDPHDVPRGGGEPEPAATGPRPRPLSQLR